MYSWVKCHVEPHYISMNITMQDGLWLAVFVAWIWMAVLASWLIHCFGLQ